MSYATLKILSGPMIGSVLPLSESGSLLGRGSDTSFDLRHYNEMSRKHARIWLADGTWIVEDLGSTNGILVNDRKVTSSPLQPGSIIMLGDLEVQFVLQEEEAGKNRESRTGKTTVIRRLMELQKRTTLSLRWTITGGSIVFLILMFTLFFPKPPASMLPLSIEQRVQSGVVLVSCINGSIPNTNGLVTLNTSKGSGFLVDNRYILTNRHVVTNEEQMAPGDKEQVFNCRVTFFSGSGHEVIEDVPAADICSFSPANPSDRAKFDTDLALLRLPQKPPAGASSLQISNTSKLLPSQHVFMEGFPEGGDSDISQSNGTSRVGKNGYLTMSPWPNPETQPHDVNEIERDPANGHLIALHLSGSSVPGDSGSAIVTGNGRVIAIARQSYGRTILVQVIPTPYIKAFLIKSEALLKP